MKKTMIFLLLLSTTLCFAGWERTYGGVYDDYGYSVAQTSDEGYIIAGWTESFSVDKDFYLIKTTATGDTQWTCTYGGSNNDIAYSVAQTSDGGYIMAGWTESDVYLIKTAATGEARWTRTYGGSENDVGYSVAQTSDSGYIVAGITTSFGVGGDVYLVKTDAYGDTIWTRTYGGSGYDYGFSVAQTIDGGYIIAGGTTSFGAGDYDVYLIKTTAIGDTQWTRTFGGSDDDRGESVAQTSDGGYIIVGETESFSAGDDDVYLIKTAATGDIQWTRTCGGSGSDRAYSVVQTSDGGYIIAGWTGSFGTGSWDVYLIKTTATGDIQWTRTYGGSDFDGANSVAQTFDSGYIIAGKTKSFGLGYDDYDVYLIKTDSLGYTAIEESPSARPDDISISAYPNPFNSAVNISLSAGVGASDARSGQVGIEIYDISGRLVADLPVTNCGSPQFVPTPQIWTPDESLGSGIYLVRARFDKLSDREKQITKRIVYLK